MEIPREIQSAINIASKTNYLNTDYQYLKNVQITEWDIKSAGLSVLKFRKLLSPEELDKLSKMDKHNRTVKEGLLQKSNPKVAEEIINTLSKVRQAFVLLNQIEAHQIMTIKKDAIFLINKRPDVKVIKDYFEFREKNTYTSVMVLGKKEFYYNSFIDNLDTKGIGEDIVKRQKDFILKDIKSFLRASEKVNSETMFKLLKSYREKYLNRQLPVETYRELDSGMFRIGEYLIENISEEMLKDIDITQNYMNYILPLIQIMI